jgi:hypothetical protein
MLDRYRLLLVIGAGLGLRQGEALGLSADDIDFEKEVVHVRRQVKTVRAKLCFALPKGCKVRDVPLPPSVARAVRQYTEEFVPVSVTLLWDDPIPAGTPVEVKHRRPRIYSLLVTGRERKAINRNYFNSYVWKPALATAGVIAPLEEGSADGARVWDRPGSTASTPCTTSTSPRNWRPANRSSPWHAGWGTPTPGSRCGSTPTSCPARAHGAAPLPAPLHRRSDEMRRHSCVKCRGRDHAGLVERLVAEGRVRHLGQGAGGLGVALLTGYPVRERAPKSWPGAVLALVLAFVFYGAGRIALDG